MFPVAAASFIGAAGAFAYAIAHRVAVRKSEVAPQLRQNAAHQVTHDDVKFIKIAQQLLHDIPRSVLLVV